MDKTIPQGASTTVWGCVATEITEDDNKFRGAYLADCNYKEPTVPEAVDADGTLREALWTTTMEEIQAVLSKK